MGKKKSLASNILVEHLLEVIQLSRDENNDYWNSFKDAYGDQTSVVISKLKKGGVGWNFVFNVMKSLDYEIEVSIDPTGPHITKEIKFNIF